MLKTASILLKNNDEKLASATTKPSADQNLPKAFDFLWPFLLMYMTPADAAALALTCRSASINCSYTQFPTLAPSLMCNFKRIEGRLAIKRVPATGIQKALLAKFRKRCRQTVAALSLTVASPKVLAQKQSRINNDIEKVRARRR